MGGRTIQKSSGMQLMALCAPRPSAMSSVQRRPGRHGWSSLNYAQSLSNTTNENTNPCAHTVIRQAVQSGILPERKSRRMDLQAQIIKNLQEILKTLEAMDPLPDSCSPEAIANHEEWMKQSERIRELSRKAESLALMALPPDVAQVYNQLESRKWTLVNLTTR